MAFPACSVDAAVTQQTAGSESEYSFSHPLCGSCGWVPPCGHRGGTGWWQLRRTCSGSGSSLWSQRNNYLCCLNLLKMENGPTSLCGQDWE